MKKMVSVLLIVLMIMAMFSGCAPEPDTMRICLDVGAMGAGNPVPAEQVMQEFLSTIVLMGGPEDVILEIVPAGGSEGTMALKRLRTEIMAGEGPDLFIVTCGGGPYENKGDALFPIPEKAMKSGLFLPLDEYIENAQYMEWDKQIPAIMDAGRDEYGQQIIPLAYTLPVTFCRAEEYLEKPSAETTWQDMVEDGGMLSVAATGPYDDSYGFQRFNFLEYALGELADYDEEKLLFTEEELLQRTTEMLSLWDRYENDAFSQVPNFYQSRITESMFYMADTNGIGKEEERRMIPIYSDDGGTTVSVAAFAAINANTTYPEDAFFVLDLLMSRSYQQKFDLYRDYLCKFCAVPVDEDLLHQSAPIEDFYLTDINYQEYVRVRDQIQHVRFRGGLDLVLKDMLDDCVEAQNNQRNYTAIVSEYYRKMERMLGE